MEDNGLEPMTFWLPGSVTQNPRNVLTSQNRNNVERPDTYWLKRITFQTETVGKPKTARKRCRTTVHVLSVHIK